MDKILAESGDCYEMWNAWISVSLTAIPCMFIFSVDIRHWVLHDKEIISLCDIHKIFGCTPCFISMLAFFISQLLKFWVEKKEI
jgi:hypothetical protein